MRDLNKIILIGRLGTQPIQRETKSGTPVTHFSLATARKILNESDESSELGSENENGDSSKYKQETVWHNVVVWGRQAQSCAAYLSKGQTVYVEGSIRKRTYLSKDGDDRVSFEVHAESVGFLGGGKRKGLEHHPENSDVTATQALSS